MTAEKVCFESFFAWILASWLILKCTWATPTPHTVGNLQPLGKQGPCQGDITVVEGFMEPEAFYKEHVSPSKPVLFKGAATSIPAYSQWTDEFLEKKYGRLAVDVEIGKKETRQQDMDLMPFAQFIRAYQTENIYMVQDVVKAMKGDLSVPRCLQCGGFQDVLEAAVIWFSSGGTKSVLHYDAVDNINCLLDGEKSLVMIDKTHWEAVESSGFVSTGGYSRVDVEAVDLETYPQFSTLPWWSAHMEKGDCLFIPYRWYHTVDSAAGRNLAVNLWFVHRLWLNTTDCEERKDALTEVAPMGSYSISGLQEQVSPEKMRCDIFEDFEGSERIVMEDVMALWEVDPLEAAAAFKVIDSNSDLQLDWAEVYAVDVIKLVQDYPFVLPGLLENMEGGEEDREEL